MAIRPTSTLMTITMTLNSNQPALGVATTSTGSTPTSPTLTYSSANTGGSGLSDSQPVSSSTTRPTLNIYGGTTVNKIQFAISGTPSWSSTSGDTVITGVVVERVNPSQSGNPGGAGFTPDTSTDVLTSDVWLGAKNSNPGLYKVESYGAKSFFSASSWTLKTVNTKYFNIGGTAFATGVSTAALSFSFRVYFYTKNVGIWIYDPMFDLKPIVNL